MIKADKTKEKTTPDDLETVEDIFINKSESNNSRFDISGNMTTWHTHETYGGTGNHDSLWDDILKEKRKKEKAVRTAEENTK
jgi:hypothetical protein